MVICFLDFEAGEILTKRTVSNGLFLLFGKENALREQLDVDELSVQLVLVIATELDVLVVDLLELDESQVGRLVPQDVLRNSSQRRRPVTISHSCHPFEIKAFRHLSNDLINLFLTIISLITFI